MRYFVSLLLILGVTTMNSENLQHVNEETRDNPLTAVKSEENETNSIGVSFMNAGLSSQNLSELHDLAKNISHSKGIYRQRDKESSDEKEFRRSLLKKVAVASESDAMKAILQIFESSENKLQLLEDMEFLVHQYDVAVNFAALGGLEIITPFLFSSDDKIASSAASVLGAALQSNPTVQKIAVKHNVGTKLLKLLSHKSPEVLSRIIFALASLLRNAAEAQKEFLSVDGVSKLADILKHNRIATNTKLKIINLFNDLAVELQTDELYVNDKTVDEIQYNKRLFVHKLQNCDICKLIPSFLDFEDYDTHQKIVAAMISLHNLCHKAFNVEGINRRLNKLLKIYDPQSDNESPLYPSIDRDLKQLLYSELKVLLKKNNEENISENAGKSTIKMEL